MKRLAVVGGVLSLGVLAACNQLPPPAAACTAAIVLPTSSVVVDGADPIVKSSNVKTIDPADIDEIQADRILADPTGLAVGDTIASNCNQGIIRKISKITTTGAVGARPQGIAKVYIETTPATLEGAINKGTVDMDFGSLDFSGAEITPANLAPGVSLGQGARPQGITLNFLDRTFNVGAATIKLSGSLENNLNPKFSLQFKDNAIDRFQVGLSGNLKLNLNSSFVATASALNIDKTFSLLKKPLEYTRTFALGAIPVVVVITLEPVIGYKLGVKGSVNAKATLTPTLTMDYGIKYVRTANPKWSATNVPLAITAPSSFTYGVQVDGTGEAYVKLIVGVKVYGVAGPNLENKAYAAFNFNPAASNPLAQMRIGAFSKGTLAFDLNVLGVGVNANLGELTLLDQSKLFNCSASACQ
ncbi:MAG: hypothetical protein ACK41E_05410 [Deinococcales bacterium]